MRISTNDFLRLCREASVRLELPDSEALGEGEPVFIDDVESQLVFDEPRMCAHLCCELGDPKEGAELESDRQAARAAMRAAGQIDAMFVRDALKAGWHAWPAYRCTPSSLPTISRPH